MKIEDIHFEIKKIGKNFEEELTHFLSELLQISRYAVALRDHVVQDFNLLSFKKG